MVVMCSFDSSRSRWLWLSIIYNLCVQCDASSFSSLVISDPWWVSVCSAIKIYLPVLGALPDPSDFPAPYLQLPQLEGYSISCKIAVTAVVCNLCSLKRATCLAYQVCISHSSRASTQICLLPISK